MTKSYLVQSESSVVALSYPWIHRYSLEHNGAKPDCLAFKSSGLIPLCLNDAAQRLQRAGKTFFPQSASQVRRGSALRSASRCRRVQASVNMSKTSVAPQPLQHQRNGTSAGGPSSGSRGRGQKLAGTYPPATDDLINNLSLSELDVNSITPDTPPTPPHETLCYCFYQPELS